MIRIGKRKKVGQKPSGVENAIAAFVAAKKKLDDYEAELADTFLFHEELRDAKAAALAHLQEEASKKLEIGQKVKVDNVAVSVGTRRGKRKVDTQALLSAYPKIRNGLSMTIGNFERLVASGVIPEEESSEFVERGEDQVEIHVEEE